MSSVKEMQKVKLNLGKLELKFSTKLVYPILPNIKKFRKEKPIEHLEREWSYPSLRLVKEEKSHR